MDEEALDEQISALVDLFPDIDIDLILQAVLSSENSRENAIDYILAYGSTSFAAEHESLSLTLQQERTVDQLRDAYPELGTLFLTNFVLANDGLTVGELMKELDSSLESKPANAFGRRKRIHGKDNRVPLELSLSVGSTSTHHTTPPTPTTDSRIFQGLKQEILHVLSTDCEIDELRRDGVEDPQTYRDQAAQLHTLRMGLLEKAATAYRKGGHVGGAIAQHYSRESLAIKRKLDRVSQKAAYLSFFQSYRFLVSLPFSICRNENTCENTIDLHHLTVHEALTVVNVIDRCISSGQSIILFIVYIYVLLHYI